MTESERDTAREATTALAMAVLQFAVDLRMPWQLIEATVAACAPDVGVRHEKVDGGDALRIVGRISLEEACKLAGTISGIVLEVRKLGNERIKDS